MGKPIQGRRREGRTNYCVELSVEAQNQIRFTAKETGLPQYEILERIARSLNEPIVSAILHNVT